MYIRMLIFLEVIMKEFKDYFSKSEIVLWSSCMVFNSIRGVACNRVNHGKIFRTSPRDEYGLQYTMVYVLWVCAFNTYSEHY